MKTHDLCATSIPFNIKTKVFRYLTVAFPHKSIRGNLYVMFMFYYDSNAILSKTIKYRQASTICDSFINIHKILKLRGSDSKVYNMDNECPSDLKEAMKKYETDFQLDSPHMHRQSAAEQAIRTPKNHFIYGFSTLDTDFPIRK